MGRLSCTTPHPLRGGIAARGNVRDSLHLFMAVTAGPPARAGGTGLPPLGGSQPMTRPRGLTSSPLRSASPQLARRTSPLVVKYVVGRIPRSDSVPQARVGPQGDPAPTRHQPIAPAPWTSSFPVLVKLQHRDILCHRREILVAGRLAHFLSFWQKVIQAYRCVLEVVSQGYSIELLQTPQFPGVRITLPPPA